MDDKYKNVIDSEYSPEGMQDSETTLNYFMNRFNSSASTLTSTNLKITRTGGRNVVTSLLGRGESRYNEVSNMSFDPRVPNNNKISNCNDTFATSENPECQTNISGIMRYGTIKVESVGKEEFVPDDGSEKANNFKVWYKIIKRGNFFLIPEEVYTIYEPSSSILVPNNSMIEEGTQITSNIISRVGGLVRIKKIKRSIEIRILPGYIYYPKQKASVSKQSDTLIPPGNTILDEFKSDDWIYLQPITSSKGRAGRRKTSVSIRPVREYNISDDSSIHITPSSGMPKTWECPKIQISTYISYQDGEEVGPGNNKSIQLVQTCLVVNWQEFRPLKGAYTSLTNIRINSLLSTFLQINPVEFNNPFFGKVTNNLGRENDKFLPQLMFNDEGSPVETGSNNNNNKSLFEYQSVVHSVPEQGTFFLTLSSPHMFRNFLPPDSDEKDYKDYHPIYGYSSGDILKEKTHIHSDEILKDISSDSHYQFMRKSSSELKRGFTDSVVFDPTITPCGGGSGKLGGGGNGKLGLLGNLRSIINPPSPPHLMVSNKGPLLGDSLVVNSSSISGNQNWYLIDENRLLFKYPLNPSTNSTEGYLFRCINYLLSFSAKKTLLINIGLIIGEEVFVHGNDICLQSGQIVAIDKDYFSIRAAKPYLATQGATIHKDYGDIIREGDTLITLLYDRLRSGDIIQGLPKVEQLLESRSIASVSAGIEDIYRKWNRGVIRLIGNLRSHFLSARISVEQRQLVLID